MGVLTCECAYIISAQRQKATPTLIDWNMNIVKVQFLLEPPTFVASLNIYLLTHDLCSYYIHIILSSKNLYQLCQSDGS